MEFNSAQASGFGWQPWKEEGIKNCPLLISFIKSQARACPKIWAVRVDHGPGISEANNSGYKVNTELVKRKEGINIFLVHGIRLLKFCLLYVFRKGQ